MAVIDPSRSGLRLPDWFLAALVGGILTVGAAGITMVNQEITSLGVTVEHLGEEVASEKQAIQNVDMRLQRIEALQDKGIPIPSTGSH